MNRKLRSEELQRPELEDFRAQPKMPIAVILDNVRSFHNVGSIFRTCDAFAVSKVYLCGITPRPPHRDIHKTALGATESVDWVYVDLALDAIDDVRKQGFLPYAIEQTENSIRLQDFSWENKQYAFVLGNEVFGVDQPVIDACEGVIEVPQSGTKHSVNVSVCAGVVLWEAYRNWI